MDFGEGTGKELPWGWWLRVNGSVIEDADDRHWHSVREAFWMGRMNFPSPAWAPEQLEFLVRVLGTMEREWDGTAESRHDLFGGDLLFWRFYYSWLNSVGLTVMADTPWATEAKLSAEGRAVLRMLQATRVPEWVDVPMREVIASVRRAFLEDVTTEREAALRQFEASVCNRRNVFARETVYQHYLVTLTGFETTGRMPIRRVMWSASFSDEVCRDRLYVWLSQRVDRWDDWAALAYETGAESLTERLFTLFLASGAPGPGEV